MTLSAGGLMSRRRRQLRAVLSRPPRQLQTQLTTIRPSAMFRFMIRDVLWLTVVVALAVGCGRTRQKIETIRQGVDDVAKHAAATEDAAKADNRPSRED
jgi:hypothetical protein